MQAVVYERFGPPEVLELREVPTPEPQDNEILVKIHATSVVHEDPNFRKSPGFNGFFKPKQPILGGDFAGEVAAVGSAVTEYTVGDRVYGYPSLAMGCHAQYVCIAQDGPLWRMPANMGFTEAAAIPDGSLTALGFLRDLGQVEAGMAVAILGASGSVGSSAVQLARHFGADVTGVASTVNQELVRSLGADSVLDYKADSFALPPGVFDIIFDTVGKYPYPTCRNALKANGTYLTTVPTLPALWHSLAGRITGGKQVKFGAMGLRPVAKKRDGLRQLTEIIEAGGLKAVIDRRYPLAEMAEAHRYVETGRKRGNVVITVT